MLDEQLTWGKVKEIMEKHKVSDDTPIYVEYAKMGEHSIVPEYAFYGALTHVGFIQPDRVILRHRG